MGKMLIEASRPWNTLNIVLEADLNCPASRVADEVIVGSLYDEAKIRELAAQCDVVTFEIEHVNVQALHRLESEGKEIIPSPRILNIIQDKGVQKLFYREHGIPTSPFLLLKQGVSLSSEHISSFKNDKVVVKSCMGGYDGKGVEIVNKSRILQDGFTLESDSVIEEFQTDMIEISVIVARDRNGETLSYDPVEMYFNPRSNLVEFLFSPSRLNANLSAQCREVAMNAVSALGGPGLFAVELFAGENGVLVNEIAPRPHNSGHHTIEGAYTSQFEQLNRILLNFPLGDTDMVCPAAMVNLVGPEGLDGQYQLKFGKELLQTPGVYIHLYNKETIRPNRKMGHITVLAETLDALLAKAENVKEKAAFSAASV